MRLQNSRCRLLQKTTGQPGFKQGEHESAAMSCSSRMQFYERRSRDWTKHSANFHCMTWRISRCADMLSFRAVRGSPHEGQYMRLKCTIGTNKCTSSAFMLSCGRPINLALEYSDMANRVSTGISTNF